MSAREDMAVLLTEADVWEAIADLLTKRGIGRAGGYNPELRTHTRDGVGVGFEIVLRPASPRPGGVGR